MFKLDISSILSNSSFWRFLCEVLFAFGKLISFILGDGDIDLDSGNSDS